MRPVQLVHFVGAFLALCLFHVATPSTADDAGIHGGQTHLLAIGVCPPYRTHIPVEVCRNAVNAMVKNLPDALGIPKENILALTDEKTTGQNILATIRTLSQTLSENDRLVFYMILHGDAFYQWADYFNQSGAIKAVNDEYFKPDEDILVFWTEEEPTIPAIAISQKDWMTVNEFASALDTIPGHIALILDSCSSGLFFSSIQHHTKDIEKIDFVATSSGPIQASNFDEAMTIPLFAAQLRDSLNMPLIKTFGEAMEHARMSTTLHATALCSLQTFPAADYHLLFPTPPPPTARTHDGQVSPPLWYCAQVPTVVDYTGDMSNRLLYPGLAGGLVQQQ